MAAKDNTSGLIYIKKNPSDNAKAPVVKGFISLSPELLELARTLEPDSYGNVKLDVALWANDDQPGVLKGTVKMPYKAQQGESRPAPRKQSLSDIDTDY